MFFAVTMTVWSRARNLTQSALRFSLSTILVTSAALICLLHPESKHAQEVMARRNRLSLPRPPFDDNSPNSDSKIQNPNCSPAMPPTARIAPTARILSLKTTTPKPLPLTANHMAMMYADASNLAKVVVDAGLPALF